MKHPFYILFVNVNDIFGLDSALRDYTGLGTTWANEMNIGVNHAPHAGSIARPVDLQSNTLPLCYDSPLPVYKLTRAI